MIDLSLLQVIYSDAHSNTNMYTFTQCGSDMRAHALLVLFIVLLLQWQRGNVDGHLCPGAVAGCVLTSLG